MAIDKKKAEVFDILHTMFWKGMFSLAALVAFFIVLYRYLDAKTTFDAIKYGAIEVLLGGTVFVAFRHYFPSKGKQD